MCVCARCLLQNVKEHQKSPSPLQFQISGAKVQLDYSTEKSLKKLFSPIERKPRSNADKQRGSQKQKKMAPPIPEEAITVLSIEF
jgi:hypothetical protein